MDTSMTLHELIAEVEALLDNLRVADDLGEVEDCIHRFCADTEMDNPFDESMPE